MNRNSNPLHDSDRKDVRMRPCLRLGYVLAALGLLLTPLSSLVGQSNAAAGRGHIDSASQEFTHHSITANGVLLHYVTLGEGEPVLLLPGWPESWYAWRAVMKELATSGRMVVALDPRGYGDSAKPAAGYDLHTAAEDIHAFIAVTGLARPGGIDVVSHDLGTYIAYAHADAFPADVRRLVLSEAVIPGSLINSGIPTDAQNVKTWHMAFNRLNDLPEVLVQGHERAYLTWLFNNKAVKTWMIDPASVDEYVRVFTIPGTARADFAYFQEVFSDAGVAQMKERLSRKLTMPVLALGGEGGVGLDALRSMQVAATDVRGSELEGCGHYLPEECPVEFARRVQQFWKATPEPTSTERKPQKLGRP